MTPNQSAPLVGIVMGSRSDWETMQHAAQKLEALGVPFEVKVVSAHRTPDHLFRYAEARDYLLEGSPLWERRLDLWKPSYTDAAMRLGQERLLEAYRERGYLQARVLNRTARPMRASRATAL